MENILARITHNKRIEVERQKEVISLRYIEYNLGFRKRKKVSLKESLSGSPTGIIAEFKRRSPSKGWINRDADAGNVVASYESAGAAAISCLTDEQFFGGGFDDFHIARNVVKTIPLLRKDFIIDEYQIYQSKAMGADVILLIASCLTQDQAVRFTDIAHSLDMEVLLELHDENELQYITSDIDVIGVNNRNLKTFVTGIDRTVALSKHIPENFIKISESGLSDPQTVTDLRSAGFRGFLMGEIFMRTDNPGATLKQFISQVQVNL
ncbi:MAG: indole-3-glycerol phosphate synthase TrpC [Dysgonamonadaceae bacterium]|jgi:indole-3-glycerol phosphate synthase|nr:indole-3-glycerol phosphate synthase TrpC [Dysgonamonadaceae bacterium]